MNASFKAQLSVWSRPTIKHLLQIITGDTGRHNAKEESYFIFQENNKYKKNQIRWCEACRLSHLHPIIRDCFGFGFFNSTALTVSCTAVRNETTKIRITLIWWHNSKIWLLFIVLVLSPFFFFFFFSAFFFPGFSSSYFTLGSGEFKQVRWLRCSPSTYAELETVHCQTQPIHTYNFFKSQNQSREKQSAAAGILLWSFHLHKD